MTSALIALLSALAIAPGADAPPAYAVGDAFVWSDGRIEQVAGQDGDRVIWRGLTGAPWSRPANFLTPILAWRLNGQEGHRTVLGDPDRIWPLRKGRTLQFRVVTETRPASAPDARWRRSLALWSCRTGGTQTVDTPAGAFTTWAVVCDRYAAATMRPLEQLTWDYAPDLGHYVRRTSIEYRTGRRTVVSLVAALHGPAATRERLRAIARPYQTAAAAARP